MVSVLHALAEMEIQVGHLHLNMGTLKCCIEEGLQTKKDPVMGQGKGSLFGLKDVSTDLSSTTNSLKGKNVASGGPLPQACFT